MCLKAPSWSISALPASSSSAKKPKVLNLTGPPPSIAHLSFEQRGTVLDQLLLDHTTSIQARILIHNVVEEPEKCVRSTARRSRRTRTLELTFLSIAFLLPLPRFAQGGLDACVKALKSKMAGVAYETTQAWDSENRDPYSDEDENGDCDEEERLDRMPTDSGSFDGPLVRFISTLNLSYSLGFCVSQVRKSLKPSSLSSPHRRSSLRTPNSLRSRSDLRPLLLHHRRSFPRRGGASRDPGVRRRCGSGAVEVDRPWNEEGRREMRSEEAVLEAHKQ